MIEGYLLRGALDSQSKALKVNNFSSVVALDQVPATVQAALISSGSIFMPLSASIEIPDASEIPYISSIYLSGMNDKAT